MRVKLLRFLRGPEIQLNPGIHDLPTAFARTLIAEGSAEALETVETATVEAPENAAKVTKRRRPRKKRVPIN